MCGLDQRSAFRFTWIEPQVTIGQVSQITGQPHYIYTAYTVGVSYANQPLTNHCHYDVQYLL